MKSYHFDPETKNYLVYCKDGTDITISQEEHKNLLIDYTVRKLPIGSICLKYDLTPAQFDDYRRAHNLTRDSLPLSDEEILSNTDTQGLGRELLERTHDILEKARDLEFEVLKEKADKWTAFQSGAINPFEKAIEKWSPKKEKMPPIPKYKKNNRWFCIGFADWHIGMGAEGRYLFRQEDWNSEKAFGAIRSIMAQINSDVQNDDAGFEGCVVVLGGDLLQGINGETAKGTPVSTDIKGEEQYDLLLSALYEVISNASTIFNKVVVHTVRGNHEGRDHYPVMLALQNYFRTSKRIEINIYSTRTAAFKIANTMVLLDHGSSDTYHADVPKSGKPRESYVQSLILAKADLYNQSNGCIFLQGDKHHFEQIEFNDFEFIMLGALPLGDKYADNNNWHSKARQNCFIVDETGLKAVMHYYIA